MKNLNFRKIVIFSLSFLLLFCLFGTFTTTDAKLNPAQEQELETIKKNIKAKGAKWQADETSVLELSPEEREGLCGLLISPFTSTKKATSGSDSGILEALTYAPGDGFDWRDNNKITSIKDQKTCGGCWAFASVAAEESLLLIKGVYPGPGACDLSEQLPISCSTLDYGCCGSPTLANVYNYLTETGTVDEACFTFYTKGKCTCYTFGCYNTTRSCGSKCADWQYRLQKISGWAWVGDPDGVPNADDLISALNSCPISVGMEVYDDFYAYSGGIYERTSNTLMGGHAILIIGWGVDAEKGGYWICKNSWGTAWGEAGYFKIKWGECQIGIQAGKFFYGNVDSDGDGFTMEDGDCNDHDNTVYPGAPELCDNKDNDCDDPVDVDEGLYRATTCGVGACAGNTGTETCIAGVWSNNTCDALAGATDETCDNVDNDCDGSVDDGLGSTTCGVGECEVTVQNCLNGLIQTCTPGDPTEEVCDNADNNCDGSVDEGLICEPIEIEVFSDSFEISEWNSLWTEDSQNDWYRSTQRATDGSRSAEVDGQANNAQLISNVINLNEKHNATITFAWFIESSLDSGEYLAFDISTDGGTTWQEKARLRGNVDPENSWQNVLIPLNDSNALKLRFRGKMSGSDEDANVDNVKVMAW